MGLLWIVVHRFMGSRVLWHYILTCSVISPGSFTSTPFPSSLYQPLLLIFKKTKVKNNHHQSVRTARGPSGRGWIMLLQGAAQAWELLAAAGRPETSRPPRA